MKKNASVFIFCATFLALNGIAEISDLSLVIRDFVENSKKGFQCGFEQLKIPTLDPFLLRQYSSDLSVIGSLENVTMKVSNVRVLGLSNFQMKSVNFSVSELKLVMEISHPYLGFNGGHLTRGRLGTTNISGSGDFKAEARNLAVKVSLEFNARPFGIKSHNVSTSIGSMQASFSGFGNRRKDRQVNTSFKFGASSWVKRNQRKINDELSVAVVAFANERLAHMINLDNVVAAIRGFKADDCLIRKDDYDKTMEGIEIIEEEGLEEDKDIDYNTLESMLSQTK